jgi:hypothetical protein
MRSCSIMARITGKNNWHFIVDSVAMIVTSRDANLAGRGTRNASRKSFPRPFSNPLKVPLFRRQRRVARRFLRSCLPMTDSFPPTIAPQADSSGNAPESAQTSPDPTEPVPITEQEVGEYREQDRYLPVSPVHPSPPPPCASVARPLPSSSSLSLSLRRPA